MVPPLDISFKISHQLIGRRKEVGFFRCFGVPMITLPALVVIAQHALASNHVRKSVLEFVG